MFKRKKVSTMFQRYTAFTLSEVLLALVIVGVVAAIAIPGFIAEQQKTSSVTSLKKFYSYFNQALLRYSSDNSAYGDLVITNDFNTSNITTFWTKFKTYLNVNKDCGLDNNPDTDCFPSQYKDFIGVDATITKGSNSSGGQSFALLDGATVFMETWSGNCATGTGDYGHLDPDNGGNSGLCGQLYVDINGKKGPNRWGRDLYLFFITRRGDLYPRGGQLTAATWNGGNNTYTCAKTSASRGVGCAGRIMEKGWIMDY